MANELSIKPPEVALALASERELTPATFHMIREMAPVMFRSKLFGVHSEEEATAIMLKGYELGLSITASFEFVQVVMGKPSLSPRGALALIHNHPEITKLIITRLVDEQNQFIGYECTIARRNGFEHTTRFTMADAKRAEVVKPGSGWEHYPENMALWRAVGFAADVVCPDIVGGMTAIMKMPEQLGVELTQDGRVIDISSKTVNPPEPAPAVTLDQLVDLFGAEAVMNANNGRLPMSDDEVKALAEKLLEGVQ